MVGTRPLARSGGLCRNRVAPKRLVLVAWAWPKGSGRGWGCRFGRGGPRFGQRSRGELVSIGKVILVVLATLVIFSTGLITGGVLVKQLAKEAPEKPAPLPEPRGWPQFLYRIQGELDLTPEQRQRIGSIVRDRKDRTRVFARGEFRKVREQIHSELTPAQNDKFEQLIKQRQRRMQEMMSQENRPGWRSNSSMLEGRPLVDGSGRPPRRANAAEQ